GAGEGVEEPQATPRAAAWLVGLLFRAVEGFVEQLGRLDGVGVLQPDGVEIAFPGGRRLLLHQPRHVLQVIEDLRVIALDEQLVADDGDRHLGFLVRLVSLVLVVLVVPRIDDFPGDQRAAQAGGRAVPGLFIGRAVRFVGGRRGFLLLRLLLFGLLFLLAGDDHLDVALAALLEDPRQFLGQGGRAALVETDHARVGAAGSAGAALADDVDGLAHLFDLLGGAANDDAVPARFGANVRRPG